MVTNRTDDVNRTATAPPMGTASASDRMGGDDRSSEQIRRDVERTRAHMTETVDALEQKLSPRQMVNQFYDAVRGEKRSTVLRTLRDNPVPTLLAAAGTVWLVIKGMTEDEERQARVVPPMGPEEVYYPGGEPLGAEHRSLEVEEWEAGQGPGVKDKAAGKVHEAKARVAQTWESVKGGAAEGEENAEGKLHAAKDKVSHAAHAAKDSASHAAHAAGQAMHRAGDKTRHAMHGARQKASEELHEAGGRARQLGGRAKAGAIHAKDSFWDGFREHPLALGAGAVAAGLITGLLFPSSRKEDEWMGEARDEVMDDVKEAGEEMLDKAKAVGEAAVDAAEEKAQEQGISPGQIGEKAKAVAREARDAAKHEAQEQHLTGEGVAAQAQSAVEKAGKDVQRQAERKADEKAGQSSMRNPAERKPDDPAGPQSTSRPAQPPKPDESRPGESGTW